MAPILTVLSLALCLSTGGLALADPLLTFYNQNPNNPLIYIAVHTFLFLLVPCTFLSAILLLLLHVAVPLPQSAIKHLTMATLAFAFATLLVGAPLMIHVAIPEATVRDTVKAVFVGAAVVVMYKPFKQYFSLAAQTGSGFVPAFVALCISTGTLLLIDPTLPFSYQNSDNPLSCVAVVEVYLLSFCNFILGIVLLFLRICVPAADRHPASARAVLINTELRLTMAMSYTTVVSGLFIMVGLLVGVI